MMLETLTGPSLAAVKLSFKNSTEEFPGMFMAAGVMEFKETIKPEPVTTWPGVEDPCEVLVKSASAPVIEEPPAVIELVTVMILDQKKRLAKKAASLEIMR